VIAVWQQRVDFGIVSVQLLSSIEGSGDALIKIQRSVARDLCRRIYRVARTLCQWRKRLRFNVIAANIPRKIKL